MANAKECDMCGALYKEKDSPDKITFSTESIVRAIEPKFYSSASGRNICADLCRRCKHTLLLRLIALYKEA